MTAVARIDDELARTLGLDDLDRQEIERRLSMTPTGTAEALSVLRSRLGTFPSELVDTDLGESAWICAVVEFTPEVIAWHGAHGVERAITDATMADVGRQFRLHRITHGRFGLESWAWLTLHLSGNLFHLGRLQFVLRRRSERDGSVDSNWVLDVHIPPTGPLPADGVLASYERAQRFFATHFAQYPSSALVCYSWLLDPYLAEHLPGSNIARFQDGFARVGEGVPSPEDVLYFVFRTRKTEPEGLPRDTALQRAVLDRISSGGVWCAFHGYRELRTR